MPELKRKERIIAPQNLNTILALQVINVRKNIKLRPLDIKDAAQLLKILEIDPSIRNHVSIASKINTKDDVAEQAAYYKNDPHLVRYVILENDVVIGMVSFWRGINNAFNAPDNPNSCGFGYFLNPCRRGNGIIYDCVNSIMKIAINNLYIKNFIAYCEYNNSKSIKVLKKLGFKRTNINLTEQSNGWLERKYIKTISDN